MASSTYLDGQTPIWRTPNGSQSITINPATQSITVENTSIPKKIIINPIELSNGTQVLPYTQLYENINAVDACVYPPTASNILTINDTLVADNGSGSITTLDPSTITLNGSGAGGPTNTITQGDMTIQDNTATNIGQMTADYVQFNTPSGSSNVNASTLSITDSSSTHTMSAYTSNIANSSGNTMDFNCDAIQMWLNTTCAGVGEINLDCNTNTLFIRNFNSGGYIRVGSDYATGTYSGSNIIQSENKDTFLTSTSKQLFKYDDAGYGYKPVVYGSGSHIDRFTNCAVYEIGASSLDLFDYKTYLDSNDTQPDEKRVGWACKIINMNGSDVSLNSDDGTKFFSHYGGLTGNPYTIKKYASVEIILIYSPTTGEYFWAVSQFN